MESKDEKITQKPAYKPPQAMRLEKTNDGAGACNSGSGDFGCESNGTAAIIYCSPVGNEVS